jgi:hypothetical protein
VTVAFDYTRPRATAERLIARFGQTGALRRMVSDGDPFNPVLTETDYVCTFAVLDYAKRDIDGTLIRQTDQQIYLSTAGLSVTPETTDQLVVGGTWSGSPPASNGTPLTVINVKPLSPSGAVVYYELQVRK